MLISILRSPTVRTAVVYAFSGLGFSVGSLLLARKLSPDDYGWVILALTMTHIVGSMGHLGAATLVVRHRADASRHLLLRSFMSSAIAALLIVVIARAGYSMPAAIAAVLLVWSAASSLNRVAAGVFRSREEFGVSLLLVQMHNGMLLVVGIGVLFAPDTGALAVAIVLAAALVLSSALGWRLALRAEPRRNATRCDALPWSEGYTIVAMDTAVVLLISIERLLIPRLLEIEALAVFAVLAAVVGAPFRVLQMGIGYTLAPRLRSATSSVQYRRLAGEEAVVVLALIGIASLLIWFLAPWVVDLFLDGKYTLPPLLILAGIVAGLGKVTGAFATAIVTALGDTEHLNRLNRYSWIALALAVVAGVLGSGFGLVGLVFGVSAGWVVYALISLLIALPRLNLRHADSGE